RRGLMRVHAALLDEERIRYEREYGRVEGSGALLQLLIHDPWFAWIRPVSELIVQIDELLDDSKPGEEGLATALLSQARDQLQPDGAGEGFRQRYYHFLQEAPAVAVAHAEARRLLTT
ncbi:MAG: hypothetical protein ACREA0_33345, partial [bacterium]